MTKRPKTQIFDGNMLLEILQTLQPKNIWKFVVRFLPISEPAINRAS